MLLILIIRVAILVTFILLIVEGVAAFVWAIRFAARYERRHGGLEARVKKLEDRVQLPGDAPK